MALAGGGSAAAGGKILVHPAQEPNPLLRHIRNVPWEFRKRLAPDFVVGDTTGVLYLSLEYHRRCRTAARAAPYSPRKRCPCVGLIVPPGLSSPRCLCRAVGPGRQSRSSLDWLCTLTDVTGA